MKAPGVFDLPDSLRAEFARERRTSARLAARCGEQVVTIVRLSGQLAAVRQGWGLSRAIERGLIRGLARGFGGAS